MGAGLAVAVADDPGMHSSQNEQDSRFYARAAHLPMLEPSDSAEALSFTKLAYRISEEYDTPALLRLTTRVSHSRGLAKISERFQAPLRPYERNVQKYVMMPGMARLRHLAVEARMNRLAADAESMEELNPILHGSRKIGVITSGIAFQYVREALPDASVLKLGMVWPLPIARIRSFAESVGDLYVVEELEPFRKPRFGPPASACRGKELFTYRVNIRRG